MFRFVFSIFRREYISQFERRMQIMKEQKKKTERKTAAAPQGHNLYLILHPPIRRVRKNNSSHD